MANKLPLSTHTMHGRTNDTKNKGTMRQNKMCNKWTNVARTRNSLRFRFRFEIRFIFRFRRGRDKCWTLWQIVKHSHSHSTSTARKMSHDDCNSYSLTIEVELIWVQFRWLQFCWVGLRDGQAQSQKAKRRERPHFVCVILSRAKKCERKKNTCS